MGDVYDQCLTVRRPVEVWRAGEAVVSSVQHRPREARRRRAVGSLRLRLRRWWFHLYQPVARWRRSRRARRGRRSIERKRTWRHSSPLVTVARIATSLVAVVFVLWVVRAAVVVWRKEPLSVPLNLDEDCTTTNFSCDALFGTLAPVFSIALASVVFLFYRLSRVHRPYVRRAKERPREVVETAGRIIGEVVGRDELCQVMIRDLRDRDTRRPARHQATADRRVASSRFQVAGATVA
jgi:hypothetical protein